MHRPFLHRARHVHDLRNRRLDEVHQIRHRHRQRQHPDDRAHLDDPRHPDDLAHRDDPELRPADAASEYWQDSDEYPFPDSTRKDCCPDAGVAGCPSPGLTQRGYCPDVDRPVSARALHQASERALHQASGLVLHQALAHRCPLRAPVELVLQPWALPEPLSLLVREPGQLSSLAQEVGQPSSLLASQPQQLLSCCLLPSAW